MTTVTDIVTLALRLSKVVALRDAPTAGEAAMGLEVFQGMFDQWVAGGMFGELVDVDKTASYAPTTTGERIRISSGSITLPATVLRDGATLPPYDLSIIEVVDTANSTRAVHIYDATIGGWIQTNALTLSDDAPFANRGKHGLACCLAAAWSEMFGATLTVGTIRNAALFKFSLMARYVSQRPPIPATYF